MKSKLVQIIAVFLLINSVVFAQQLPQYSNYMLNYFALNPAAAGTPGCLIARLGYRSQWVGQQSAPQTAFLSAHSDIKKKKRMWINDKHAWGFRFENDATGYQGPITRNTIQGAYAYHKPIGNNVFMSMGVFVGIQQYEYKIDNVKLPQTSFLDDPVTAGGSGRRLLYPDINPGVMVYGSNWYTGYSLKNIVMNKLRRVYGGVGTGRMVLHHYITGGYRFGGNDAMINLIPSANIKIAGHLPPSFDLTLMASYLNQLDLGIQYRFIEGFNGIVNLRIKQLSVGYAYDFNLSKIRYGSANSHELIIGYRFCLKEFKDNVQKEHCPAYR